MRNNWAAHFLSEYRPNKQRVIYIRENNICIVFYLINIQEYYIVTPYKLYILITIFKTSEVNNLWQISIQINIINNKLSERFQYGLYLNSELEYCVITWNLINFFFNFIQSQLNKIQFKNTFCHKVLIFVKGKSRSLYVCYNS